MAESLKIIRSLEQVSTGYTVFERDQVLTEGQLNGNTSYLDDQERLTRVELLGVGIVDGLRVQVVGGKVRVGKGAGVTTDGDLLMLPADATYDRIKDYDETAPQYPPFYPDGAMIKLFELVREGESDAAARDISTLPGKLADMVVLMLMESYQKDQDLCSGTDCDNLGKDALNTMRLLLVSRADAAGLAAALPTDRASSLALPEVAVERPLFAGAITTTPALATLYRNACNSAHVALTKAFSQLYPNLGPLLAGLFGADPAPGWNARLDSIRTSFAGSDTGIQYYHDFLRDLAETWNALCDTVYDADAVLCPDFTAFPKHLLLGDLSDPTQSRTALYPSPLAGASRIARDHARFLAWKLHTLVSTFELRNENAITVTPSQGPAVPLEARAIPYYYVFSPELPIHRSWNHRLSLRGAQARNLGYRASEYGAPDFAHKPLAYDIARYDFFRIEGHIGQALDTALAAVRGQVASANLPIAVRAILLHNDTAKIVAKPPIRYGDLHRFHYLLRKDIDTQLARSSTFSQSFKSEVTDAVGRGEVPSTINDKSTIKTASDYDAAINSAITQSRKNLTSSSYLQYRADPGWKAQYTLASEGAGKFKQDFGHMLRNDFSTAFDTFLIDNHLHWADWLDTLIDTKEQQEDKKLLFQNFIKEHPGLDHAAGACRGGTFVLVYDDSARVVADFMLPYFVEDVVEEEAQPALPVPTYKPPFVYTGGYQLVKPLADQFTTRLDNLRDIVEGDWKKDVSRQEDYLKFFTSSVTAMTDIVIKRVPNVRDITTKLADPRLDFAVNAIDTYTQLVDKAREAVMDPALPDDARKNLTEQLRQTEAALATTITDTAQYIASARIDLATGSEGSRALAQVTAGMDKVNGKEALTMLQRGLRSALDQAAPAQKTVMSNVITLKGLGG